MSFITNGDFANGLTGWTVQGAGFTAPTFDPVDQRVVFGRGNNDVQDGDRLEQVVALNAGQEYTLTFSMTELGRPTGGFGLNIELIGAPNTQFLTFAQVVNDETRTISVTFTSNFDDPVLRIRGAFGFGGVNSALILDNFTLTCFGHGTRISTPAGPVAIEALQVGGLVDTLDDGACPLRWVGARYISPLELHARPEWCPIRVQAGSFGPGRPARDLYLTPCHRVLLRGPWIDLLLGEPEGLVPVKALVGLVAGIDAMDDPADLPGGITYYHLLFDSHQIVQSEGLETESFHPTQRTVGTFDPAVRSGILAIRPGLLDPSATPQTVVRPILKARELRALFDRVGDTAMLRARTAA